MHAAYTHAQLGGYQEVGQDTYSSLIINKNKKRTERKKKARKLGRILMKRIWELLLRLEQRYGHYLSLEPVYVHVL